MQVNFGRISPKNLGQSKKVVITRGDVSNLDLKLKAQDTPGLKTELRTIKPGEQYELEVTLIPPFPETRILENLALETGLPEAPTVSVRVYAIVPPRVTVNPRYFSVPQSRDSEWEQSVRLEWNDEAPHKILGASVEDPKLTVQVQEKNGTQLVVLHVPEDYVPRPRGPSVLIKTDDTKESEISVAIISARTRTPNHKSGSLRAPIGGPRVIDRRRGVVMPTISKRKPERTNAAKPTAPKPDTTKPEKAKPDSSGSGSQ